MHCNLQQFYKNRTILESNSNIVNFFTVKNTSSNLPIGILLQKLSPATRLVIATRSAALGSTKRPRCKLVEMTNRRRQSIRGIHRFWFFFEVEFRMQHRKNLLLTRISIPRN